MHDPRARAMAVRVAVDDGVMLAVQLAEAEVVGVGVGEGDAVGELVIVQLGECVFGGGYIALSNPTLIERIPQDPIGHNAYLQDKPASPVKRYMKKWVSVKERS